MKPQFVLILSFLAALVLAPIAWLQTSPGYMDADYYFATGMEIAAGRGFMEPFLWNYLDDPNGIPHPSHAYWMPLASILAASGVWTTGLPSYSGARISFILLALLIPLVTSMIAYRIHKDSKRSFIAGVLACIPGFYLPYLPVTDTFGLYMLLGSLWLIIAIDDRVETLVTWLMIGLGIIAGCLHLARADGIMWLFLTWALIFFYWIKRNRKAPRYLIGAWLSSMAGYMAVMGLWMLRNLSVFGTPLASAGAKTLWLTGYDEFFSYPASILTFQRWSETGMPVIISAVLKSIAQNLQTALVVQGSIILVPLIILGMWDARSHKIVRLGLLAWSGSLIIMSVVFPYSGWRGGFFHSGAAVQPLFWALTPVGLEVFLTFASRVRGWKIDQARVVFTAAMLLIVLGITGFAVSRRVIGDLPGRVGWNISAETYHQIDKVLVRYGAGPSDVVMVNNPPGYYVSTGRSAIVIPFGDIDTVKDASQIYQAKYLLLDKNYPAPLADLFHYPGHYDGLDYLGSYEDIRIMRIR